MRRLLIMYPDGKYHTVNAHRFYGVLFQGNITYVLEYDDLTDNVRNRFNILDREGNTFVNKPFVDQAAYSLFASAVRFSRKRSYHLNVLPGKIELCKEALLALNPLYSSLQTVQPVSVQPKKELIVYKDIGSNHDKFPFYVDRDTALFLGFSCDDLYYHLDLNLLDTIKREYYVRERVEYFNFGRVEDGYSLAGSFVDGENSKNTSEISERDIFSSSSSITNSFSSFNVSGDSDNVIIYEDVSPIRENFPFYVTRENAKKLGLVVDSKDYYHLEKEEFEVIYRFSFVEIIPTELAILPQKNKNISRSVVKSGNLTPKEIETIENLFDGLMDFEDYYSFFGMEALRNVSPKQVLSSPRMIALTNLFQKGKECGNDLAINLMEFLDGFRNDLIQKSKKK